jgi:DNA-binding response OmpR family regulator
MPTPAANTREVNLLLVEDDTSTREVLTRGLAKAGFAVSSAESGIEAVELARARAPDVLVIDLFLPDAGGLGVAREVRREERLQEVPVLFISGLSSPAVRDALAPAPVLFKPFTFRQLLARLREIVREG